MDTAINEGAQSGSSGEHIQEEPAEGGFGDDGIGDMDEPDADERATEWAILIFS